MNRSIKLVAVLGTAVTVATATGAVSADAAPAHHTGKLNKSDVRFLRSNEQANLAEITLGKIALDRLHNPHARKLARVTIHDHRQVQTVNEAVSKRDGVSLPTQPNASQRQAAAQLSTQHGRVAITFFKDEVAGHKKSIRQTEAEIRDGSKPNVVAFAKYYLPIAQKHLRMAETDLRRAER